MVHFLKYMAIGCTGGTGCTKCTKVHNFESCADAPKQINNWSTKGALGALRAQSAQICRLCTLVHLQKKVWWQSAQGTMGAPDAQKCTWTWSVRFDVHKTSRAYSTHLFRSTRAYCKLVYNCSCALQWTLSFMFEKVSKGAHYVCATKVHGSQNCMYPPVTMAAALWDPTSPHGYMSDRCAGSHFPGHEKLFLDHSIFRFLAKMLSFNPNRVG